MNRTDNYLELDIYCYDFIKNISIDCKIVDYDYKKFINILNQNLLDTIKNNQNTCSLKDKLERLFSTLSYEDFIKQLNKTQVYDLGILYKKIPIISTNLELNGLYTKYCFNDKYYDEIYYHKYVRDQNKENEYNKGLYLIKQTYDNIIKFMKYGIIIIPCTYIIYKYRNKIVSKIPALIYINKLYGNYKKDIIQPNSQFNFINIYLKNLKTKYNLYINYVYDNKIIVGLTFCSILSITIPICRFYYKKIFNTINTSLIMKN